jgi:hypothetical protein
MNNNSRTSLSKSQRDRAPNAAARARDKRALTRKIEAGIGNIQVSFGSSQGKS